MEKENYRDDLLGKNSNRRTSKENPSVRKRTEDLDDSL